MTMRATEEGDGITTTRGMAASTASEVADLKRLVADMALELDRVRQVAEDASEMARQALSHATDHHHYASDIS